MLFFMLTDSEFYRMIYLVPFIYIVFVYKNNLCLNLLVELIAGVSVALVFFTRYFEFFEAGSIFQYIRDIIPKTHNPLLAGIREELRYIDANTFPICFIAASVYFAAILILIIINYPRFRIEDKDNFKLGIKSILWGRMLTLAIITFFSLCGI